MEQIAFGQLKWKPTDFNLFSFREFNNAIKGHSIEIDRFWAMARQIGFYTVVMNQGKNKIIKKPQDLFKLGIDQSKTKKIVKYAKLKRVGKD